MKKIKRGKLSKKHKYILIGSTFLILISLLLLAFYSPQEDKQNTADFGLTDINGQSFRLSDFRGKIVILDFMAIWCGPCRIGTNNLIEVWQMYEEEITIISIDIDPRESNEDLRTFSKEFPGATWIWARDTSNLAQTHRITAIPTLIIIGQDGNIVSRHVGVRGSSALISEIDDLIS